MYIRLTILFMPQGVVTTRPYAVFDEAGGTIGRSADNDWVLPGPEVSRHHAQIQFSGGSFQIRDQSTNGVYLNSTAMRVTNERSAFVNHGDLVYIGGFTLRVAVAERPFADGPARTGNRQDTLAPRTGISINDLPDVSFDDWPLAAPEPMAEPEPEPEMAPFPAPPPASPIPAPYPGNESDPFADLPSTTGAANDAPLARALPVDTVDFAVFGPQALVPGRRQIIDVWAFGKGDFDAVKQQAAQVERNWDWGRKVGLPLPGEATVKLTLSMPDVEVFVPSDIILWRGAPASASFVVALPEGFARPDLIGTVTLSVDGIPLARITFVAPVQVGDPDRRGTYQRDVLRVQSAFASYASVERAEVLARLQGMRALCPDLDIFLDVLSLRAGDDWEARLRAEIPARDAFYLFWSQQAAASEWVAREWHIALDERGLDYIVPVPLQDPRNSPPPQELSRLHFNDAYLDHIAYLRLQR